MKNAMTVDVEDYFQVSAFEKAVSRDCWDSLPHRVVGNTQRVLNLLEPQGVLATFFVLGWVAERYPELVREIVARGHELASHGYQHTRATQQDRETFGADVRKTKWLLEDVGGTAVKGYRAASYSINRSNWWALDELAEAGYTYSSSVYPIKHDLYGVPDAPRFAFRPNEQDLTEIPVSTVEVLGRRLPCGGGGFFRLYPYRCSRWAIRRVNEREGQPCVFYFHPWEVDPEQPRPSGLSARSKFRHYLNLPKMESRLQRLLADLSWDRMDRVYFDTAGAVD